MALFPTKPIESAILEILALTPKTTTAELKKFLIHRGFKLSTAKIYRIASNMMQHQMLVKNNGYLSLHEQWKNTLFRLTKQLQKRSVPAFLSLPGKTESRKFFSANSIAQIIPIWNHLQSLAAMQSNPKIVYQFGTQGYFFLSYPRKTERQISSLAQNQAHVFSIIGDKNWLNQNIIETYYSDFHELRFRSNNFFLSERYMISIIRPQS